MEQNNATQQVQDIPQPSAVSQPAPDSSTPREGQSRKRILLLLGGLVLGIVIILPICQFLVGFFASMPEEMASTAQVIDDYMKAMTCQDINQAYTLVSKGGATMIAYSDLAAMMRGNNYLLFAGYREISITDFQLTQFATDKYAEVAGSILYQGDFVGEFSAALIKEHGIWKIQDIRVTVPPDKFGKQQD